MHIGAGETHPLSPTPPAPHVTAATAVSSSHLLRHLLQVFMEFAKEQESEEVEVGSLSTTFQWHRLRQDGSISVSHADSVVHQL